MARRSSGGSSGGSGCFVLGIIALVLLYGNVALFTGSASDSPILAIIAVLGDLFLIGMIIKSFSDRSSSNNNTTSSPQSTPSTQTRSIPSYQSNQANSVSNTIAKPAVSPVQEDRSKLGRLKERYNTPALPSVPMINDPLQKSMEAYQCRAVLQVTNKVINQRKNGINKLRNLKKDLESMLSCPGCSSDRERIKFLNEHKDNLEAKRIEYLKIFNALSSNKVRLLTKKDDRAFGQLRTVFAEISKSQKITGDEKTPYNSFATLNSSLPGDLFDAAQSPIELNFGWYHFYLLPEVILVFNKDAKFITAIEPMALIISIQDCSKDVYASNRSYRGWTFTDNIIASDSTFKSHGETRTSWLHEKKNGGPDLRYSDNPMYQYRTETYSYTAVKFQICSYHASFSASKGQLASKLRPLFRDYCSKTHGVNVIPSLLRLLEATSKDKASAETLSKNFESTCSDMICKEVNI